MNLKTATQVATEIENWHEHYHDAVPPNKENVYRNVKYLIDSIIARDTDAEPTIQVHRGRWKDKITYTCPRCDNSLTYKQDNCFCGVCGQRIDWSKVKRLKDGKLKLVWRFEDGDY